MTETAQDLIDRIRPDIDAVTWAMEDPDIDLQARYHAAILEVGAPAFVAQLFLDFEDSTLAGWLKWLDFAWEDLPFSAWKEVLGRVAWNHQAVYRLVWQAARLLAVDMVRVILDDPDVDPVARACAVTDFPRGAPRSYSSLTGEPIVPPIQPLWRRLAAEGAPMLHVIEAA